MRLLERLLLDLFVHECKDVECSLIPTRLSHSYDTFLLLETDVRMLNVVYMASEIACMPPPRLISPCQNLASI